MKRLNRRFAVVAAAAAVLAVAIFVGIAQAVSGSESSVSGAIAKKARAAAVVAAGGGTAGEVERQDEGAAGVYEVEVRRADGSQIEVHLDAQLKPVGVVEDDDKGSEKGSDNGSDKGEGGGSDG